jgi:membrane fusion protein, copper/silver efflux system
MKTFISKKRITILFTCVIVFGFIAVSCGRDHKGHDHNSMDEKTAQVDSSIIRTGEIDLIAIDVNKDGKVYQDPMDWNVISDKPGKCPLCKMTLIEVSIEQAKENLVKNGFEVK